MNILFNIIGDCALIIFQAFVLMKIWDWHIVTAFGMHHIGLGHFVGISGLISIIRYKAKTQSEIEDISIASFFIQNALTLAIWFAAAWVAS